MKSQKYYLKNLANEKLKQLTKLFSIPKHELFLLDSLALKYRLKEKESVLEALIKFYEDFNIATNYLKLCEDKFLPVKGKWFGRDKNKLTFYE